MIEGGCFCGAIRYQSAGNPVMKGQCHCRQCQYFAGGAPNLFMAVPRAGFRYVEGNPSRFSRGEDVSMPVVREFCPTCGVQVATVPNQLPELVFIKVGTLDDPATDFGGPQVAIFTCDRQDYQPIPDGVPSFEKLAPM